MNYNIYGSKFGLYGYLPAVLKNKKNTVFLKKKYKKCILFFVKEKCFNKFALP